MVGAPQNELSYSIDEPLTLSNRTLALVAGARTDLYTIHFARLACASFLVSSEGQRIFNNNLLNTLRFACADERLQFGFGDEHLFRHAGVKLFEYEHLILASALGEFFGEDYAAAIFSALADGFEDENRSKPQLSAFKGFVSAINGMLSSGTFSLLADDRIRLNPFKDHDYDHGMPHASGSDEFVPPMKVVTALTMLSKLKAGQIQNLTIFGGDMLGWFSVYAEMFLGINTVLLGQDGRELYRCKSHAQSAQVRLVFVPPNADSKTNDGTTLWLREPIDLNITNSLISPKSTGRITGESMFSKVFGKPFQRLDQSEARVLASCLGAVARSWELMARSDAVQARLISAENRLDLGAQGLGLIQTWTNWFPELRHLQGRMERGLKLAGHTEVDQACMEGVEHLERLCGCYLCSETQGTEEYPTNLPVDNFCLPTMMETIIMLGLSLSRVVLVPDLYPSRAGILATYNAQARKRLKVKQLDAQGNDRSYILFNQDWNLGYSERLRNLVAMFSGVRSKEKLPENLMAFSHEGITAYVMKLQRRDTTPARSDDNAIRVVIGPINWRHKTYRMLCLGPVRPAAGLSDGWESFECSHLKERIFVK